MNLNKELVWHIVLGAVVILISSALANHFSKHALEVQRFENQKSLTALKHSQSKEVIRLKHSNGVAFHTHKVGGNVKGKKGRKFHKKPQKPSKKKVTTSVKPLMDNAPVEAIAAEGK